MFSSITSYLFGAVEPDTEDVASVEPEQRAKTEHQPTEAAALETRQDDDEWILVEKSGTPHSDMIIYLDKLYTF
jgi:hypothetical protein